MILQNFTDFSLKFFGFIAFIWTCRRVLVRKNIQNIISEKKVHASSNPVVRKIQKIYCNKLVLFTL